MKVVQLIKRGLGFQIRNYYLHTPLTGHVVPHMCIENFTIKVANLHQYYPIRNDTR